MENDNRLHRLQGRQALRSVSNIERCQDCGRFALGNAVGVRRTPSGVVGFAGLNSCGNVWLCPMCNAKVMAQRAIEIGVVLAWAHRHGLQIIWGSLTLWHNQHSDLSEMMDIQAAAWRSVVSSRTWRSQNATRTVTHQHDSRCYEMDLSLLDIETRRAGHTLICERSKNTVDTGNDGRVGYIRASEVTIGRNGWHPHFHPLIVYRGSAKEAQAFADAVVAEWMFGVDKAGGFAGGSGAQQLTVQTSRGSWDALGAYMTKATYEPAALALELVWSQGKSGRGRAKETVSHWSLLAEISKGLADEVERWWELEEATPGRRMISWSRGLRDLAALDAEQTDEDIAAAEVGSLDDTVCFITTEGWVGIREDPEFLALMLNVLASSGWAGLRPLLDVRGVEYDLYLASEPAAV